MKIFVLILCSVLPVQAFAHFVCSETIHDGKDGATQSKHFRVYLRANGRVSISGTQNSEPFLSLVGEWEEEGKGRLDMTLRDANDVAWSASGTRFEGPLLPQFHSLTLGFSSDSGQSFALRCTQTELY